MKTFNHTLAMFLAASSIALAVPLAVEARPMGGDADDCRGPNAMQGHRDGVPPSLAALKLTSEQRERISALRRQDADLMDEKFKHVRDTRAQLDEMEMRGEYDEVKVRMLTEEGARVMAEMAQIRARQQHQMMAILTPEQRQQFAAQRAETMKRRQHPAA